MRFAFVFAVSLLFFAPQAEAGPFARCRAFFAKMTRDTRGPGESEASLWRAAFGRDGDFPYLTDLNDRNGELLLAHVWKKLPPEIQDRLAKAPPSPREMSDFLSRYLGSELFAEVGVSPSYLSQLTRFFQDSRHKSPPMGFSQWIRNKVQLLTENEKGDPSLASKLESLYALNVRQSHADAHWMTAGRVPLPLVEREGKTYLQIGDELLSARKTKEGWTVLVPKNRIARPAWNPLESRKLAAIMQNGIRPPKQYETVIGHDGKFYLMDGNHRFQIDSRDPVPVTISDPPQTSTLLIMFDLINHPQPTREEKVKLLEGRLGWQDLLKDSPKAKEFLLRP